MTSQQTIEVAARRIKAANEAEYRKSYRELVIRCGLCGETIKKQPHDPEGRRTTIFIEHRCTEQEAAERVAKLEAQAVSHVDTERPPEDVFDHFRALHALDADRIPEHYLTLARAALGYEVES